MSMTEHIQCEKEVSLLVCFCFTCSSQNNNNILFHSCHLLLGVNLSQEFVNLSFSYAGQGLLFFCWWQQHFEFQLALVAVKGRSNVRNTHERLQISLPTKFLSLLQSVSMHLTVFQSVLLNLKQQQNLMSIMFSCIHLPIWPYPPKIMIF